MGALNIRAAAVAEHTSAELSLERNGGDGTHEIHAHGRGEEVARHGERLYVQHGPGMKAEGRTNDTEDGSGVTIGQRPRIERGAQPAQQPHSATRARAFRVLQLQQVLLQYEN